MGLLTPKRGGVLLVLAALVWAGAGEARAGTIGAGSISAKDFLSGIYQAYVGRSTGSAKGVALDSPDAIRRYFTHGLASVILEDGSSGQGSGSPLVLGNDPFVGHDNWDIADLSIDVKDAGPAKAVGTVRFSNFGQAETVTVDLLKMGNNWRIAEIKWGPLTLRGLYKTKWQAARSQASLPQPQIK